MVASETPVKFPLVGVGASEGGVESFQKFLRAIPADSGMAYILIQHLSPAHESMLHDILSRSTTIPVLEIVDDCRIEPDHIYVIPKNRMLGITGHSLKLTPREKSAVNMPIDLFFASLAREHGSFGIGVVLSGNARDGTVGLRNIREHGGITFAEDPKTAAWDGMPKNAIQAGVVDFVFQVGEIPARIIKVHALYEPPNSVKEDQKSDIEYNLEKILYIVRQQSGVDFSYYKKPTLLKRIDRRMAINQFTRYEGYLGFLRENKSEQEALFQDLLLKVTTFFKDPEIFEELGRKVFPRLLEGRAPDETIRIWIPACSTGEEAYSLAFGLFDSLGGLTAGYNLLRVKLLIFASDISRAAIKKARSGTYNPVEIGPISEWQREDYFIKTDEGYQVVRPIRDTIVFTVHNFLNDPPFGKVDLISCRDMLSNLDPLLHRKALSTFHYALKENGFLLLGKSETIDVPSGLFAPFSQNANIFSRKPGSGSFLKTDAKQERKNIVSGYNPFPFRPSSSDFRKSAEAVLVSTYSPASIVVDEHMEVVHINGNIAPFLGSSSGSPTHQLMDMAGQELAFELRNALLKARDSRETEVIKGIPLKYNGRRLLVTIEIVPLTDILDPHYLILFRKKAKGTFVLEEVWENWKQFFKSPEKNNPQWRITTLERELEQVRVDMSELSEEHDAYTEELQSANEEMLSSHEEILSLNEELETSREELKAINKELIELNHELVENQEVQKRIMRNLNAVISNLREPFVVLEKDFKILAANASYYKKFEVNKSETVGRLFFEVRDKMWDNPHLRSLLQEVLPRKRQIVDKQIVIKSPTGVERSFKFNARKMVGREKVYGESILLSIDDIN